MDEENSIPFKQYFPQLSLEAYFWLVIFASMILFSIIGYFVGVRVDQLTSSNQSPAIATAPTGIVSQQIQTAPHGTPIPGDDNDIDYSAIEGYFVTDSDQYDQFVIYVNGIQTSVTSLIDSDTRSFTKPHLGIQYPYMFSRLNPATSYAVSASACRTNPQTYALICAKNIVITKCTGQIQQNTCIIKGNGNELQSSGEVDFSLAGTDPTPSGF